MWGLIERYWFFKYSEQKRASGVFMVTGAIVLGSFYPAVSKLILEDVSPYALVILSSFFSALAVMILLGAIPEFKKLFRLTGGHLFKILLLSLLASVLAPVFLFAGLEKTSAINAVLLLNLEFVFTGIISAIWLKEKVTLQQIVGVAAMMLGGVIIITKAFSIEINMSGGDIFIIIGTLLWAFSNNIFKKHLYRISPGLVVLIRNIVGVIILLPLSFLIFDLSDLNLSGSLSYESLLNVILFSVIIVLGSQILWFKGIERVPAITASSIGFTKPFFGVLAAVVILGDKIEQYHLYGGFLIIIGLIGSILHRQQAKQPFVNHRARHIAVR